MTTLFSTEHTKIVRTSGLMVPKSHPLVPAITSDLVRVVKEWDGSTSTIILFKEYDDYILIPRYYKSFDESKIEDRTCKGKPIEIESKIVPNSERQRIVIEKFKDERKGIISLEPGTGKTVIAIHLIANYYKVKSLIVAHKDKLLDQWKDEFLKHTNITEDRIGRLYSNNFEEVFKTKDIILSTPHIFFINENNEKFHKTLQESGIGVLFIDECHVNIGPEQFSKVSLFVNAYRTFGLSATPSRYDGLDDILSYHVGNVFYVDPFEGELLTPKIYMIKFSHGVFKHNQYFMYGGKLQLSRYLNHLHKSEKYLSVLSSYIRNAYAHGRKLLVLGSHVRPLFELAKYCKLPKEAVGLFTPSVNRKDLRKLVEEISDTKDLNEAFYTKQIVFATYGACRDGNNRKDLDALIMSTPTSNPIQAIGRVLRKLEGKRQPIVLDIVDLDGVRVTYKESPGKVRTMSYFERLAEYRKKIYEQQGWIVIENNKSDNNK